jgi:UV DNA damage endonuclease
MSSNMFPWMSEYELSDLPDWNEISLLLKSAGNLATQYNHRIEFHPGPFNVLASHTKSVVDKTIKDLNQHAQIFDAMGFVPSHWNQINIHVNTTQGGKALAAERFCENFQMLSASAKARLVVENDDKPSQYSVKDLFELIYSQIQTPITFDVHHHKYCSGNMSHSEAAKLAASTWPVWIPAGFHFASTINHEQPDKMARAHADWIYEEVTDYGTGAWIMCECKAKEQAIIEYIKTGPKPSEYKENFNLIYT